MKKSIILLLMMGVLLSIIFACSAYKIIKPTNSEQDLVGKYEYRYTEEIEGEKLEFVNTIDFYEDNTGLISFQDEIPITWKDGVAKNSIGDVQFYYSYQNNSLIVVLDDIRLVFNKVK